MGIKLHWGAAAVARSFIVVVFIGALIPSFAQAQQGNRQIAQRFNQLPPCQVDSFVYQAGDRAEAIYGDEGISTPPPYFGFDQSHRIDYGIRLQRDEGITTGHGSILPSAWGYDEFIAPPGEFCQSGAKSNLYLGVQDSGYDYGREIDAYDHTIEELQERLDAINNRLLDLAMVLKNISPADISGRQDIDREITALQRARLKMIVRMQALQEKMRQHFGEL